MYRINSEGLLNRHGYPAKLAATIGINRAAATQLLNGTFKPSYDTMCKYREACNPTLEEFDHLFFQRVDKID